jgi:uncharacterized secreted protein with C-terminal beta-propeller domain
MALDTRAIALIGVAFLGGGLLTGTTLIAFGGVSDGFDGSADVELNTSGDGVTTFDSPAEYRAYIQRGQSRSGHGSPLLAGGFDRSTVVRDDAARAQPEAQQGGDDAAAGGDGGGVDRHSETNVQVQGIDEPDVLKTDGEWIYYAGYERGWRGTHDEHGAVLDATDPSAPNVTGEVPAGEEYLLADETLVSIGEETVHGFDVSDPAEPVEEWTRTLNHSVHTARLLNGTVYLVLEERPDPVEPCPVAPMGGDGPTVDCQDVYRPAGGQPGDATYTALALEPETGNVGETVSFVGSGENTVVYVSRDAIYLSYEQSRPTAQTRLTYLLGTGSTHLDSVALDRLRELRGYDLTPGAMRTEIRSAVRASKRRQSESEREDFEKSLQEGYREFVDEHKREIVRTGIVRIGLDERRLSVTASGSVPGRLLNQFSMGEREGHLQVATTTNPSGSVWENDLYTLSTNLTIEDSITGLGTDQRIYSVRYVGDRAYIVTFRQVDPFYVIDTADPTDLQKLGKLKLPGYSEYMHPLGEDRILGIGEEERRVKATIFDASDPEDPVVEDDVVLDDHWSAVSRSHHAFLLDEKHEVFFLPGSDGGHIYSYADGLDRVKTVDTDGPAVRALYIDDYLYVFGTDEVVVLDQTDWSVQDRQSLE